MINKVKPITWVGIILSLFGMFLAAGATKLPLLDKVLSDQNLSLLGLALVWVLTVILLGIVKFGEKASFDSIGFKPITLKAGLLAIGIGIVLSLAVPVLTLLVVQVIPTNGDGIEEVASSVPWWLLLLSVLTAGITEEIIFRGYLIERLGEISSKNALIVVISVIAFVLPHTLSWNLAHVLGVVLPLGLILSLIYLWKRNLVFNIIIHIVIDLPLVVMALMAG